MKTDICCAVHYHRSINHMCVWGGGTSDLTKNLSEWDWAADTYFSPLRS